MINAHHTTIWRLLDNLKKGQRDNEILILQLKAGHHRIRHPVRKSYIQNMEHKEANDVRQYLWTIGFKIKKQYAEENNEQTEQ